MNDRELMQQALELQALIRKIDAEVKAAGLDTYTAVHNGRMHLIATVRNFLAVATGHLPDWLLQPAKAMSDATELETGNKVEQSAQQHVNVTDELVDAYCKGWEQSFLAGNPYHTVHASEQDKKHIKVGLRAALAEQPAQQEPIAICEYCEKERPVIQAEGKPWVGLTDEDVEEVERWVEFKEEGSGRIPVGKLVRYIEAKLREKNA